MTPGRLLSEDDAGPERIYVLTGGRGGPGARTRLDLVTLVVAVGRRRRQALGQPAGRCARACPIRNCSKRCCVGFTGSDRSDGSDRFDPAAAEPPGGPARTDPRPLGPTATSRYLPALSG
jgi:hypothetical protein